MIRSNVHKLSPFYVWVSNNFFDEFVVVYLVDDVKTVKEQMKLLTCNNM